jgi:hypothetical protein
MNGALFRYGQNRAERGVPQRPFQSRIPIRKGRHVGNDGPWRQRLLNNPGPVIPLLSSPLGTFLFQIVLVVGLTYLPRMFPAFKA